RNLVAQVEWIAEILHDISARHRLRLGLTGREQRLRTKQIAVDRLSELFPARRVGPFRVRRSHASTREAAGLGFNWQVSQSNGLENACGHAFKYTSSIHVLPPTPKILLPQFAVYLIP